MLEQHGSLSRLLKAAKEKLSKQHPAGPNLTIKIEVMKYLDEAILYAEKNDQLTKQPQTDTITPEDIANIKNDLEEIKAELNKTVTKTYAQMAAQTNTGTQRACKQHPTHDAEEKERVKRELEKTEVTLAIHDASDKVKEKFASMNDKKLTGFFQEGLAKGGMDLIIVHRATKTSKHIIKIRGTTEDGTTKLRELNWKKDLEGAELVVQTYGIILNGVPKYIIDFERDTLEEIKTIIESANHGLITVERVKALMNRPKNPEASTHSIVIFTKCPKEADKCMVRGMAVGYKRYFPEKYKPQFQIKQCFNCQGFGHKAGVCTGNQMWTLRRGS